MTGIVGRSAAVCALWLALAGRASGETPVALTENPHALDPTRACGVYCVKFLASYLVTDKSYAEIAMLCSPGPQGGRRWRTCGGHLNVWGCTRQASRQGDCI